MVKISRNLENKVDELVDFEVNEELSDEDYIAYTTTKEYSNNYILWQELSEKEKSESEIIPSKFNVPLDEIYSEKTQSLYSNVTATASESLPSKYDLRVELHQLVKVKNQMSTGTCWAFSSIKSVETAWTRKNLDETGKWVYKDLSEIHLAVMSDKPYIHQFAFYGGDFSMANSYFKNGLGPIANNDYCNSFIKFKNGVTASDFLNCTDCFDIFGNLAAVETANTSNDSNFRKGLQEHFKTELKNKEGETSPALYVFDTIQFSSINAKIKNDSSKAQEVIDNRNNIKSHIMKYGSVYASICAAETEADSDGLNLAELCIRDESKSANHAVSLIGWDDTKEITGTDGKTHTGAYLSLNSWGENWNESGSHWISYDDYLVESSCYGVVDVDNSKRDINSCSIEDTTSSLSIYTGEENERIYKIKYGDKVLSQYTDYTIEYENNVNAGINAKAIIKGINRYEGTVEKTFSISPKNINNNAGIVKVGITMANTTYEYTGKEIKPGVNCKMYYFDYDANENVTLEVLKEGKDYNLTYVNNTQVGTATVTVTGINNYSGTQQLTFEITGKDINSTTVTLSQSSYEYDGNAKTPDVIVTDSGKNLSKDTDYTVSYSNNTNAGKATVTITGKGKYTGTKTLNFEITSKAISSAKVTLPQSSYEYDGNAKTPKPTVVIGEDTLIEGTDYTLKYTNNTNIGTATITVTGINNYTGTKTLNFEITGKAISSATVTLTQSSYEYDGNAKTPDVTVKISEKTLSKDTDYTVSYSNNINAGTATVTVTGKGNYKDNLEATFAITARNIDKSTLTLSQTAYEYDGTAKLPNVTVEDLGKNLIKDTDYTISYSNNTNAGTATVVVTGKGNYTGSKKTSYKIEPRSVTKISNENIKFDQVNFEYDKTQKKPTVTITDLQKILDLDKDYTLEYGENINAGNGSITIKGKNNYKDSRKLEFVIKQLDIRKSTITLEENSYFFDGMEKKPKINVKNEIETLVENKDYVVEYDEELTMPGVKNVKVTGLGNYDNIFETEYVIIKRPEIYDDTESTINFKGQGYQGIYDGNAHGIEVNVTFPSSGAKVLYGTTKGKYTYSSSPKYINAGTYTIYYKITSLGYESVEGQKQIVIKTKEFSDDTTSELKAEKVTYNGNEQKPEVEIKDKQNVLEYGKDYEVAYENNLDVGIGKIVINGKGNYKGTISKTFEIERAVPEYIAPSGIVAVYGSKLKDISLPEHFEWQDDLETLVGDIGEHVFKCKYVPTDTKNYYTVEDIEVKVKVTDNFKVNIEKYFIEENADEVYIEGIDVNSKIKDVTEKIETNGTISVYDKWENQIEDYDQNIKTGMKIKIKLDDKIKAYVLVVDGDVNGDGKLNSIDLLKLSRYVSGLEQELKGAFLNAGNIYKDENIDKTDIQKMANELVK